MTDQALFPPGFFDRSALEVAPDLIGCVLVSGQCRGRIVEVEAYLNVDDAASHAHRGMTARNAVMFGPSGRLYVYFTYGMHWCANVVTGPLHDGQAVLLRGLEPIEGLEIMRERRQRARRDVDLTNGPAKLCEAFGIGGADNGADLVGGPIRLEPRSESIDQRLIVASPRIGISKAIDQPWRWALAGNRFVSR
ncbi:MAG: DNA-3-methyladenine glycosylase [Acidimicrobiia bacterium]